jgi:prepilin-type N-terminal cleavage/methylation domain-containing protein
VGKNNFTSFMHKKRGDYHGFTIVELLVVILVIGILAGISIVGYGAWRKNIAEDQLKSELSGVASAMENARNFSSTYPTAIPSTFTPSNDVTLTYVSGDAKTFCIQASTSQDSTLIYRYDISEKKEPQVGACGVVVVPTIANAMHNPNPSSATYWKSSSESEMSLSFPTVSGNNAVRSTRVTTNIAALYGERNGVGVVSATTGDQYTLLFTVVSNVTTSVDLRIGYGTSTLASTVLAGVGPTINLVANVPQTIVLPFTVPSGITAQPLFFKLLWNSGAGAIGNYFDVYKVMWVAGNYNGTYRDGYSAGWSWSGTPNLSTSSGPSP